MFDHKTCASLVLSLGLLATPAVAQQPGPAGHHRAAMPMMGNRAAMMESAMPMMGMMHMMMGEEGMDGMRMMAAMTGHVEGRLAFLKTEIRITDAQLPQWEKFAEAVRDNAKAIKAVIEGRITAAKQSPNLPERLAMRQALLDTQLAAVQKLKSALDPLYAALSDTQKKTADDLTGPMAMMM